MFFRIKRTGSYPYVQIVESFRDGGKVRQRVLTTLGRLDVLQQTGNLDGLIRSGLRFCKELAVIDAHAQGETQPVTVRRIAVEKGSVPPFDSLSWTSPGRIGRHKSVAGSSFTVAAIRASVSSDLN